MSESDAPGGQRRRTHRNESASDTDNCWSLKLLMKIAPRCCNSWNALVERGFTQGSCVSMPKTYGGKSREESVAEKGMRVAAVLDSMPGNLNCMQSMICVWGCGGIVITRSPPWCASTTGGGGDVLATIDASAQGIEKLTNASAQPCVNATYSNRKLCGS